MKKQSKLVCLALLISGLSACETIDEDRYAGVACKDLKQLVATNNLASLGGPRDTGVFAYSENEHNRDVLNVFEELDYDKKRDAELRAAYRNNCR